MKRNDYFSHDGNARNDAKLLRLRMKHGAAGYGVYFMILERLREEDGYVSAKDYNMIAFDLRVDAGLIKSVVEDFGLFAFTGDGECFYSESFNRRMSVKDGVSAKRAEAAKKGLAKRWGTTHLPSENIAIATETDDKNVANALENDSKSTDLPSENIAIATETDSKNIAKKSRKKSDGEKNAKNTAAKAEKADVIAIATENDSKNTDLLSENIAIATKNDSKKSKGKEKKEIYKERNTNTQTRACACEDEAKRETYCEERKDYFVMKIVKFYNEMIGYYHSGIKPIKALSNERIEKIAAVLRRFSGDDIGKAVCNAMKSDYLNGRTKRRRQPADFDWIFDERNFIRILEGNC